MNPKIDFNDVPKNYLYCTHSKCPRRNKCLRYQATLSIKPYCNSRFACGIDHILDNLPYSTAVTIRKELYSLMGRSMFYRIRNKERMLHPDEQKQIVAVFLKHGIENKPEFDQYIDLFDW